MGMPLQHGRFTADMVRAFPDDGNRYELVAGELLVTPAPASPHQRIVLRLARRLADHCDVEGRYETMISPADISWGDDETLVQPDVFVVPRDEAVAGDWAATRTLVLVAEVLSPSTARHDRFTKRRLYQARKVATLWLVNAADRSVEVWTPHAEHPLVERIQLTWNTPGNAGGKPLSILLDELFAD